MSSIFCCDFTNPWWSPKYFEGTVLTWNTYTTINSTNEMRDFSIRTFTRNYDIMNINIACNMNFSWNIKSIKRSTFEIFSLVWLFSEFTIFCQITHISNPNIISIICFSCPHTSSRLSHPK